MLFVWNVMSRDVVALPESTTVRAAARALLDRHVHGAPVVDDAGHLLGVVSLVDLTAALLDRPTAILAELLEGRAPVTTESGDGLYEAAQEMVRREIHRLVVVDAEGHPTGVVTPMDLLRAIVNLESGFQIRKAVAFP